MPTSWTKKRERQYQHIKESEREQGRSTKRAKQIAAATVNKQRRRSGETGKSRATKSSKVTRSRRRKSGSRRAGAR